MPCSSILNTPNFLLGFPSLATIIFALSSRPISFTISLSLNFFPLPATASPLLQSLLFPFLFAQYFPSCPCSSLDAQWPSSRAICMFGCLSSPSHSCKPSPQHFISFGSQHSLWSCSLLLGVPVPLALPTLWPAGRVVLCAPPCLLPLPLALGRTARAVSAARGLTSPLGS